MPRRADPGNEVQRKRQERYRRNLNDNRKPEVGMIDTALVNSLAIYAHLSADREKDQRRLEALKTMAVKFLMSKGYSEKHSEKLVSRRVARLDVIDLIADVNNGAKLSK